MEHQVYREEVWLNRWALISLGFFITMLTPISFPWLFNSTNVSMTQFYQALNAFFIFIFINFRKLDIVITTERIKVRFGLIKKTLLISDVTSVEPENATLWKYTGFGIRYGGDGSLAFIASPGLAIQVKVRCGRSLVFSTSSQKTVTDTINSLM